MDPGVQELEALIDTIQKQLKDLPRKDNICEAFQVYDKEASGYVDKEVFFKTCGSLNIPVDDSLIKEVSRSYSCQLIAEAVHHSFSPKERESSTLACGFGFNRGRSRMLKLDLLSPDHGLPLASLWHFSKCCCTAPR